MTGYKDFNMNKKLKIDNTENSTLIEMILNNMIMEQLYFYFFFKHKIKLSEGKLFEFKKIILSHYQQKIELERCPYIVFLRQQLFVVRRKDLHKTRKDIIKIIKKCEKTGRIKNEIAV